jgi:autotransporter-associated beta strand protein
MNYESATGTTGVTVASNAILNLKGGLTTPANLTSVTLAGGGTLSFASGLGEEMDNLTALSLGVGVGTTTLELDVGDSGTDKLTVSTAATVNNIISLLIKDIDLTNSTTYDLIVAASGGLTSGGGSYTLNLAGYTGSTLTVSDTLVQLNVGTLVTSDAYWNAGGSTTSWATVTGSPDFFTNFSTDPAGTSTVLNNLPGKGQKVIFQADNLSGGAALTTTLDQPFKINTLDFRPSTNPANTSASVTIDSGVGTNTLTIAPSASTDGINMATGSTPIVNISAGLVAQGAQTWTVTETAQALNLTGALTGAGDVTKAGNGTLTLGAVTSGYTGAFKVAAGTTVLTHVGALSGLAGTPGAGAAVEVAGGSFYYQSAVAAGTISNNLELSGGTLSASGTTVTYSGALDITAPSFINMRDANSATTSATARQINLTGTITGTAPLTVDSNDAPSAGNQLGSNLVINKAASTWSGDLNMTRGSVFFQNVAGGGNLTPYVGYDGVINFNQFGRVIYRNIDGGTLTRTAAINFAAGAVGEFQLDNLGFLVDNYTLTQQGGISLNSGSIARITLQDAASDMIISGGISLNGNASFTVNGGDADSLVTITGTGFTGTGNLAINDEAGVWNINSSRLHINAASTFVGDTSLNEGILILGNKDALSSGSLTITGASTLQTSTNLTGANAVANVVNLGNTLTVSGTSSLELTGIVTNTVDANRTLTNNLTSPALLTLSGSALNLAPVSGTSPRTFTLSGTGSTTISAPIVDGNSNANALTVTSSGTTTLSGPNTYTGTTTMNQATGILLLQGSNSSSAATTLTAGTIQLDSASNGGLASGDLTLTAGTLTAVSTARSLSNNTLLNGTVALTGIQDLTFNGSFTNNGGNRTLTNNITSPAVATLAGNVLLTESGTAARTLTISGSGNTLISGVIANGVSGTAIGTLAKSGIGTLTLSSTGNSYTGGTTINLGTVRTTASDVIPNTGTVTVNATTAGTALLDLNGNSDTIGALTLGGTGGLVDSVNQVTTGAGTLTLGGNVTVTTTGNWTTPALISGTLALGGTSRTFTVNNSTGTDVDLDLQATVTGTAGNSVTKAGAGVLLMTSTGGTWGGGTVVSAGELRLGASNVIPNTGTVTLNGGATSILNLNDFSDTIAALSLGGTGGTVNSIYQVNTGAGTLTLGGTVTVTSTGNWTTSPVITGNLALGGNRTFTINNSTGVDVDLDLQATVTGTATQSFTKGGAGVLSISSTGNNWGGGTVVSAGEIRSGASDVIPNTGTVTLNGGGSSILNLNGFSDTIGALTLGGTGNAAGSIYQVNTGAGTLTLGGTLSVTSTANTTGSVISGNLDLGGNRTISVAESPALADLEVSALVSGAFTLNKTGAGALLLSNASNSYTGATTISGGIISIAADSALGTAPGTPTAGHLTLNGGGLNTSTTMTLATNRGITLGASGGALLPNLGTTLTVDSAIDGVGGLMLNGTGGDLILSGADSNTYAGVTTVTAGTLTLSKTAGALAIANPVTGSKDTPNILVNGGTLVWGGDDQIGDNSFINVTSGTVNFNNRNETLFNLVNSGGSINYGTGDITIEDPIWSGGTNTVSGNTTFGFLDISGGTNNVTGTSGGGAGLLTIGSSSTSGPLTFSGANNTPTLNLNSDDTTAGRLRFRAGSTIELQFTGTGTSTGLIASTGAGANAGEVDLNGSTRTFNIGDAAGSAIDMTISAKIVGTGAGITKTGAGTLALTVGNTFDGGTTVSTGTLLVNNTSGSATGTGLVQIDSGATLGGSGIISGSGAVTVQGILDVGNAGDLGGQDLVINTTAAINLTGATLNFDLWTDFTSGVSNAFPASDLLNLTGSSINISGATLNVSASANGLNTWAYDTAWRLFDWNSITPSNNFGALNLPDLSGWDVNAIWDTNDLLVGGTIKIVNAIPEPSRAMLLLLGLLSLGFRRRRDRF